MTLSDATGGTGTITVAGADGATRQFVIAPLDLAGEDALYDALEKIAEAQATAQRKAFLTDLSSIPTPSWAHLAAVRGVVDSITAPVTAAQVDRARASVEGVVTELWHRARVVAPSLTLAELRAVVTAANASGVRRQMMRIVQGAKPVESKSDPADAAGPAGAGPVDPAA